MLRLVDSFQQSEARTGLGGIGLANSIIAQTDNQNAYLWVFSWRLEMKGLKNKGYIFIVTCSFLLYTGAFRQFDGSITLQPPQLGCITISLCQSIYRDIQKSSCHQIVV